MKRKLTRKQQKRNNLSESKTMTYSTLAQFKAYLGIDSSDTSQDNVLTQVLNSANSKLNHLCGVDDFSQGSHTQTIEKRGIFESARGLEFYLKNKPVSSINKLNGEIYSGVKGTDYLIIYDRRAIFKSLPLNDRGMLEVDYTSGFQTIPDDLKLLEMMLGCGELPDSMQAQYGVGLSSYKLGDESITFGSRSGSGTSSMTSDDIYFSFTALLDKYKNFNLPL